MKKLFTVFLVILSLTSCEQAFDKLMGIDVYDHIREPTMEFATLKEAGTWIARNIRYDASGSYEWQAPQQTIERRSGMCVDYCILLLWYANEFGCDTRLLLVKLASGGYHALAQIDGVVWEAQAYIVNRQSYVVMESLSLEEALEECYYYYGNRAIDTL